jgi:hypothetical protein
MARVAKLHSVIIERNCKIVYDAILNPGSSSHWQISPIIEDSIFTFSFVPFGMYVL